MGTRKAQLQSVAVVSKAKMQLWLGSLQQAGLYCDKMLPDILALPHTPDAWNFVSLGGQAIVRQDEWQGMQGDTNWILPAIEHYAKQQNTPLEIANHSEQSLANLANVSVQEQTLEMPMQLLANGALKSNFNLLQGEYKPKKQASGDLRKWRLVAVLAAVALLVTLIDKGFEVNQLKQQSDQLTDQMQAEYKRAFPNKPAPVNIRKAMERDLAALQRGGGGVSVIAMMAELADAFDNSNVKPQSIRFDAARTELRLQAVASNFEALEMFKRLAQQKGFAVEQGAINNKDNQVIGSLSIRS
jgi:general secretion pathway protein L